MTPIQKPFENIEEKGEKEKMLVTSIFFFSHGVQPYQRQISSF